MRRMLGLIGLLAACVAYAGSGTLRVGSQVLVVGDSAARVVELLGKPTYKSRGKAASHTTGRGKPRKTGRAESAGEQWQYRVGNRLVTVVVADGKVSAIRD
ncbi:DUF2845 domain-containing protein [Dyella sp. RRB7]|uniref:DUF2845 domain-containing protein n=1 Tax=Dyella sp. RRB7 TaxID=2919502 RepID=UPI001FA9DFB1|nr:DUF2845 domain-containing protein [Dyella sp. RRB7]